MNTNGTQMERIDERVPDAFQKRFLLGYSSNASLNKILNTNGVMMKMSWEMSFTIHTREVIRHSCYVNS